MALPLSDFVSVEHEVRRPLRAAQIMVTVMQRRLRDDPVSLHLLELIDRSIQASRGTLSGWRSAASTASTSLQPQPRLVDAGEILANVFAANQPFAARKGLKFRLFAPTGCWTHSDATVLRRIIENLVSNAIKFTRAGGVLLGVRWREGELHIEIWDTGPGIAAEHRGQIFEEFFQADREQNRRHGSGLGLANVQQLAALLDHRIELRSTPGRGTVFSVVVPDTRGIIAEREVA